jgi:protein-disulfide isomerase-like protein with CxxC motif
VAIGDEQVTPTPTVTPTLELAEIGEVLGLEDQACSETFKASGEIYIDSNADNVKQADEKGVSGIKLVIYTNDTAQNIELKTIFTNTAGQWTIISVQVITN